MGFLLSPAFWPIGALGFLILFWLIFSFFGRSRPGKRIARELLLQDSPDAIAGDADEVRGAAVMALAEAEHDAERTARTAEKLRQVVVGK